MVKIKDFKKETARDFLALGSWIFYILVIARALIQPYRPFVDQMVIAGILLLIINLLIKNYDSYISRGLILVVFTILFYNNQMFSIFAILALIGIIISSYFVGNNKIKILKGGIIGAIVTAIAYYLANFSLNLI
tara:strand:- start:1331 stop:1732 length:402 start_codon:yes stop_codon:yes gene_type:complete